MMEFSFQSFQIIRSNSFRNIKYILIKSLLIERFTPHSDAMLKLDEILLYKSYIALIKKDYWYILTGRKCHVMVLFIKGYLLNRKWMDLNELKILPNLSYLPHSTIKIKNKIMKSYKILTDDTIHVRFGQEGGKAHAGW